MCKHTDIVARHTVGPQSAASVPIKPPAAAHNPKALKRPVRATDITPASKH
jgi:hypothetical protein